MVDAIAANNWDKARELHYKMVPLVNAIFAENNPAGVKTALNIVHNMSAELRLPLVPLSKPGHEILVNALEEYGLK